MGIEPGGSRTRSATARPCEFDIAEVTSLLMTPNLCITSSSDSPRFLSSMMATSCSVPSSGTAIAAQRPRVICWIVFPTLHWEYSGRCELCGAYFAPLFIDIDSLLRMVYGHRKPASEPRRC
jgi:hypothetical protein